MKKYLVLMECRNYNIRKRFFQRVLEERVHDGYSPSVEVQISGQNPSMKIFDSETGQIFKEYPVCIGGPETPTAEGTFLVAEKWINPYYKKNGEYYFGKRNGLGGRLIILADPKTNDKIPHSIHGIKDSNFSQGFHTQGCIRLPSSKMREFFECCDLGTIVHINYTRNST